MKNKSIELQSSGIKKILKQYDVYSSISEYIWNGFDATATEIKINYSSNDLGLVEEISIIDNGYGIIKDELDNKFKPFLDSLKINNNQNNNQSKVHGKKGVGRLTFFCFSSSAKWKTFYSKNNSIFFYEIEIEAKKLQEYKLTEEKEDSTHNLTGTEVNFYNINGLSFDEFNLGLEKYICKEYAWYIELQKPKVIKIIINGKPINYDNQIISTRDTFAIKYPASKTEFKIEYINWSEKLNNEFSKFYFKNSNDEEVFKEPTSLNLQGDKFYHSVYIKSNFFNTFNFDKSPEESLNMPLFGNNKSNDEFKFLIKELKKILIEKRKSLITEAANKLVESYEKEHIFPEFKSSEWDLIRKSSLESLIKQLYEVEPKIFKNLNLNQKKIFVRFLNLLLDSDERDNLLNIVSEVISLNQDEQEEFLKILGRTKLSNIIQTMKLIEDRYKVVQALKNLVFNEDLHTNEVNHLQKVIEAHYWLFGEEYNLVTAAEPDFEEALRRYIYLLTGEKKSVEINHEHKNKEMDIFMCRQNVISDTIENIVVELKHPKINLGEKELSQVKKYMSVILDEDRFNDPNSSWCFYLVGNKFNKYIEGEIKNNKHHGEKSLVYNVDNYKIYVKTWSEIFTDFQCRHDFINKKLQLIIHEENKTLLGPSANDIVKNITSIDNLAKQETEIKVN